MSQMLLNSTINKRIYKTYFSFVNLCVSLCNSVVQLLHKETQRSTKAHEEFQIQISIKPHIPYLITHICVLLLVVSSSLPVNAQSVTISGTVKDAETREPLPYANIVVEGTTTGTTTNESGYFELSLP